MTVATDEALPFVDEHLQPVVASVDATWEAVVAVMTAPPSGPAEGYARLVRARDGRPLEVAASVPPRRLVLVGEHRFARYSLVLTVDVLGPGLAAVRAQTWAAFPGALGRLYRTAVIGSRGHVLAVRWILARVARRAERAARPSARGDERQPATGVALPAGGSRAAGACHSGGGPSPRYRGRDDPATTEAQHT